MKINKKFIFLFIAVLITTILEGKAFFLSILYSMIILFFVEFILMKLYESGIKINNIYNINKLECGSKYKVQYKVLNNLIFRIPNVCINTNCEGCNGNAESFISLLPRKKTIISEEVCFLHRGKYSIGEKNVYLKSLFGIFEKRYKICSSKDVDVYPNEYELNFNFLGNKNNNAGFSGDNSINDYDIKGIKDYVQGDSVKHINWKNTAKGNKIMVNEYNGESGNGDYIILDMNSINYDLDPQKDNEERMIDFVCSLCKSKIENGENMNIIINNDEVEAISLKTKDDYLSLVKYFVENESKGNNNIENIIKTEMNSIALNSGIVVVVNEFTEEIETALNIAAEDKRFKIKVICNKRRNLSDKCNDEFAVTDLNNYIS